MTQLKANLYQYEEYLQPNYKYTDNTIQKLRSVRIDIPS